ncbi:MAG: flagellar basal body-associated FliL family protein [Chlamydiia bacterium]|nr:flagellar basal body-associated FliL family protein [Chlamydiia bacterium]
MAEEQLPSEKAKSGSRLPLIAVGAVIIVAAFAIVGLMTFDKEPSIAVEKAPAEYAIKEQMYQLKDGSYLRLGFSIVVDEDQLGTVRNVIEKEAPGRLPSGITMLLGNKTRQDLIAGTHKREAFAREIKKMIEDRVFGAYNKRQVSAEDTLEVREVLISNFVTQNG